MTMIACGTKPTTSHLQENYRCFVEEISPTEVIKTSWMCTAKTNNVWSIQSIVRFKECHHVIVSSKECFTTWRAHCEDGPAAIIYEDGKEKHNYYLDGNQVNTGPNGVHSISYFHDVIRKSVSSIYRYGYWLAENNGMLHSVRYNEQGDIIGCGIKLNGNDVSAAMLQLLQNGIDESDPLWEFQMSVAS